MTKVVFRLDKERDMKNRFTSANKISYWKDRSENLDKEIIDLLRGAEYSDIEWSLWKYIESIYSLYNFDLCVHELNQWRSKNGDIFFSTMERIVQKPIPVDEITCYLTSTWRCPYNPDDRHFLYCPLSDKKRKNVEVSANTLMHELLHMMLHYYYESIIRDKKFTNSEFHDIKEAQTVILNVECKSLLSQKDNGYASHAVLREKLLEERKKNKNFEIFVQKCMNIYREIN